MRLLYDDRVNKIMDLFEKIKTPDSFINPKTNQPYTHSDGKQVAHRVLGEIKDMNNYAFPRDSQGDNFWCDGARLLVKIEILALLKQCEPSPAQYRLNFNIQNLCRMMTQLCKIDNPGKRLMTYLEQIALIHDNDAIWDGNLSNNMQASIRLLLHDFKSGDLHSLIGIVLTALLPFMPINFLHESHVFGYEIERTTGGHFNMKKFYHDSKHSKS